MGIVPFVRVTTLTAKIAKLSLTERKHVSNGCGDSGGGADADGAVYGGVFGCERD